MLLLPLPQGSQEMLLWAEQQKQTKSTVKLAFTPSALEWGELFWPNKISGTATDCECDHKSPFSPEHPWITHACRDVKMPPVHPGVERPLLLHGVF